MSLRFRQVSDIPEPPGIEWVWENRIPRGYVSMLGGPGGAGKSGLVASLEVAVVSGQMFVGGTTLQGAVVHVDLDTDERAQLPWVRRAGVGQGVRAEVLNNICYVDHEDGGFLDLSGVVAVKEQALSTEAVLIVVDAFTSALPFIRSNDAGEVMQAMATFRQLAKDTNAAVLIIDHTPKPTANMPTGRGLLGSTMKSAGARAVHLLSVMPPKEVGGLDVLRLETHKNNLAPVGEPLGIQRIVKGEAVRFEMYDLPSSDSDGPATRAQRGLETYLNDRAGSVIPRQQLFGDLISQLNVSERTLKRVVAEALSEGTIRSVQLSGRGNPVAYKSVLDVAEPGPLNILDASPPGVVDSVAPNVLCVSDDNVLGTAYGPKTTPGLKPESSALEFSKW